MKVAMLTREFPPEIYGGAGVHVEQLAAALAPMVEVKVHCFGAPRPSPLVEATYEPWDALAGADAPGVRSALGVLSVDLAMAAAVGTRTSATPTRGTRTSPGTSRSSRTVSPTS